MDSEETLEWLQSAEVCQLHQAKAKRFLEQWNPRWIAGAQRISTCFLTPHLINIFTAWFTNCAPGRGCSLSHLPKSSPQGRDSHLWTQANRVKVICFYTFLSFIRGKLSKPASNDTNFCIYKFPSWLPFISKSSPGSCDGHVVHGKVDIKWSFMQKLKSHDND